MKKLLGTTFNLRRKTATKSIDIGDYGTLDEAKASMVNHFNITPKRGNIEYIIREENLEDYDGVIMRSFSITLSGGGKSTFYKRYTRQELEIMTA